MWQNRHMLVACPAVDRHALRARASLTEVVPTPGSIVLRASAVAERARAIVRAAYVEAVAAGRVRAEAEHHVVRLTVQRARVASGGRREVAVPPGGALIRVGVGSRLGLGLGSGSRLGLGLGLGLQPSMYHRDKVKQIRVLILLYRDEGRLDAVDEATE